MSKGRKQLKTRIRGPYHKEWRKAEFRQESAFWTCRQKFRNILYLQIGKEDRIFSPALLSSFSRTTQTRSSILGELVTSEHWKCWGEFNIIGNQNVTHDKDKSKWLVQYSATISRHFVLQKLRESDPNDSAAGTNWYVFMLRLRVFDISSAYLHEPYHLSILVPDRLMFCQTFLPSSWI
jgi:hypothetical protein